MIRLSVALILALLAGLAITGCQNEYKTQLLALQQEHNDLRVRHQRLQQELADREDTQRDLLAQLDSRETELAAAQAQLANLKESKDKPSAPEGWQETASGAKVTLASDILFGPGQATISKQGDARLRQIAATIKDRYPKAMVRVYGFSDSDPIRMSAKLWKDNLDLSANRAMAVTRLLRKLGIDAGNIETVAMGAARPVAPNSTKAGKAKNRRVEIMVVSP